MKECVIAHWSSAAAPTTYRGSSRGPKLWIVWSDPDNGRGAFCGRRSLTARTGGGHRSANAGMSSVITVRTSDTECLRVPGHRQSTQGESGPKPRTSRRRRWRTGQRILYQILSLRAKGGRDREGEPIKWTGWVPVTKCAAEENPGGQSMTHGPSVGNRAEVIGAQVAKKSLSPERDLPVPQTDTGRQRASSSGERAIPCQGTRQIDPVPLEEGGP